MCFAKPILVEIWCRSTILLLNCQVASLTVKDYGNSESVFIHVHHFLIHVASIDRLLDKIYKSKNGLIIELIPQIIGMNRTEMKSFRRARNHLEHFEERLEAWLYMYPTNPVIDMNTINVQTQGLSEDQCLRLLITDENILVIMGEKFYLSRMYTKICLLSEKVNGLRGKPENAMR
jgi:hypothetical protein